MEFVGTTAVVVSLIYVGLQVRQNTAAIQTNTSHAVYQQHQEQVLAEIQSADFAEVLLKARRRPEDMTAVDSLRYDGYLNLRLNLLEAVYTSGRQGTMEAGLAAAWLDAIPHIRCLPGMETFWAQNRPFYHRAFRTAMDSAFAAARCD